MRRDVAPDPSPEPDPDPARDATLDAAVGAARDEVVRVARAMHAAGLVVGTAGNVSVRIATTGPGGDLVGMTPAAMPYDVMTPDDVVVVDLDGELVGAARARPTTEKDLHLACYRRHRDVGAVVHTHPAHASMFAVAREPIPAAIEEVVLSIGGDIPCGTYQPTGTPALGAEVAAQLADRSAVLMANHGLVCVGRDADDALHNSLVVERTAQIVWGARALGRVHAVPADVTARFADRYRAARASWRP